MTYPGMSAEVFQNANISILACQLFVMVVSLLVTIGVRKATSGPASKN